MRPIRIATFIPISTITRRTGRRTSNTTGPEIMEQTGRPHHALRRAMGTSGTFVGVTRRLQRDLPHVKCYFRAALHGFHGLEGTEAHADRIVPGIYDETLADGNFWLETEDAYAMVRRLAREEGLLVGISSGGNVLAALTIGAANWHERGKQGVIVTILCDGADKYLSEHFWDE